MKDISGREISIGDWVTLAYGDRIEFGAVMEKYSWGRLHVQCERYALNKLPERLLVIDESRVPVDIATRIKKASEI